MPEVNPAIAFFFVLLAAIISNYADKFLDAQFRKISTIKDRVPGEERPTDRLEFGITTFK